LAFVGETGDLSDRPLSHERKPPYDRCAVCDSGDCVGAHSIDLDKETQIRWWHCADCGLVFQNPRLTGPSLRAFYAKADYFGLRGSNNRMLWDARGDLGRGLVGELTHGRGNCGLL
jgi:hypothetical protein